MSGAGGCVGGLLLNYNWQGYPCKQERKHVEQKLQAAEVKPTAARSHERSGAESLSALAALSCLAQPHLSALLGVSKIPIAFSSKEETVKLKPRPALQHPFYAAASKLEDGSVSFELRAARSAP